MNIDQTISDLSTLSVDERLRIVQKLWDSIPRETEVTLSPDQRAELERRIAAHEADPESAISRDELERRLKDDG
jgi:putative addiction module component (TIGR02574 family)